MPCPGAGRMLVPWCDGKDGLGGAGRSKGHTEVPWQSTGSRAGLCPPHLPRGNAQTWHSMGMSSRGVFPSDFFLPALQGGDKTPTLLLPGRSWHCPSKPHGPTTSLEPLPKVSGLATGAQGPSLAHLDRGWQSHIFNPHQDENQGDDGECHQCPNNGTDEGLLPGQHWGEGS